MFHDYAFVTHVMVEIFTDADWVLLKNGRRSITLCTIFCGGYLLDVSSGTQEIVNLSFVESWMYAAVSGAYDVILIASILFRMFDVFLQICLYLDSAAATGIINRRGAGKVCHLSCRSLSVQERMASGSMIVRPVSGLKSPTHIGMKRVFARHV